MCAYLCECSVHTGQKRFSDSLKLESYMSMNHLTWLLGTKLGTSARTVHAPNHEALSLPKLEYAALFYSHAEVMCILP